MRVAGFVGVDSAPMSLSAEIKRQPNSLPRVILVGRIDESASIDQVLKAVTEDATIDMSQVQSINSIGLMRWVAAFTPLSDRFRLEIERVPYCLAIQANHVSDLFGRAHLKSCSAPYFCPSCKTNNEVGVEARELDASGRPPDRLCPSCGGAMDFDETDGYFAFLSRAK